MKQSLTRACFIVSFGAGCSDGQSGREPGVSGAAGALPQTTAGYAGGAAVAAGRAGGGTAGQGSAAGMAATPATSGANGGGAAGASGAGGAGGVGAPTTGTAERIAYFGPGFCALTAEGAILCWGNTPDAADWRIPAGVFTALSGAGYVCAIDAAQTASCFAPPGISAPEIEAPAGATLQVAMGHPTTCTLSVQNEATCQEVEVAPPDEEFLQLSAGSYFACGIRKRDRQVTCWGHPGDETLCQPDVPEAAQLEPPSGRFKQISSKLFQSCGIREDDTLACWGAGKATDSPSPNRCGTRHHYGQSAPPAGRFVHVSVGAYHACAVRVDGAVSCWGAGVSAGDCQSDLNLCGQALPTADTGFVQVASGDSNSCGLRADGTVRCWGSNTFGRSTPPSQLQ